MKLYGQKTYYSCIEAAAEEISRLKGGLKGNIVVFCEDKLTLSVEEAIVKKLGGTFNVEVLTFGRYISEKKSGREGPFQGKRGDCRKKNTRKLKIRA